MPDETVRLDSWKQIAAYLQKSERTVRRWHETEGLPVHKHQHQQRGSVWAYASEIDAWRQRAAPTFLFVGEKQQYDIQYRRDQVERMPLVYVPVYAVGNARLFSIANPRPASASESWMGR